MKHLHSQPIIRSLLIALAVFVTGRLGLMVSVFDSNITLIWPPTGIAVAALLRWGFGCWPGIALGAFAVNLAVEASVPVTLIISVGSTLGPMLAAWGMTKAGFHSGFDRRRDVLFLGAAAMLGMVISATIGVAALSWAGVIQSGYLVAWLFWWLGDTLGVVTAAPLILTCTRAQWAAVARQRVEFAAWLGVTLLATWGVFVFNDGSDGAAWPLGFLSPPLLAWAALRYGPVGTSISIAVISIGAAYGTATGHGPLVRSLATESAMVLGVFISTATVLGWLITALQAARVKAMRIQTLFEQALTDGALGVVLCGLDRRITYVNQGFTQLTGYIEAELLGKFCTMFQGPETDAATAARLTAAVMDGAPFEGEMLSYRKDGTTFWNALVISPARDERGAVTGFVGIQRDISKRKQAEHSQRDSENRYRALIETSSDAIFVVDLSGRILSANQAAAQGHGYTVEELLAMRMQDLDVPESATHLPERLRRMQNGEALTFEVTHRRKDGSTFPVEVCASAVQSGGEWLVVAFDRDITERKAAAAERERSLETLQIFIDSVPAFISFVDAEGRYRLVNRRYQEYFGFRSEQIIGRQLSEVRSPAVYAEILPHVRAVLAGQEVRYAFHSEGPDGRSHWFDVQYVPRFGEDGSVSGFFKLGFDVTETKLAETALRESETRFRRLFEANPWPMWVHDFETLRFLAVNDAAIAHYGFSRDEFLGMTTREIRPPSEVPTLLDEAKAVAEGKNHFGTWRHRKRDGTLIDAEVSAQAIEYGGQRVAMVLAVDVTERRRAETRNAGERAVLELLASNAPLPAVLDGLARSQEEMFPGMLCSVLLLDADGRQLRRGAAPSLPEAYCQAIDGIEIGPAAGSCGTAAFTRLTTVVADISADPLWLEFRDVALAHGLHACWSVPVISSQNRVLGTLALYYRSAMTPSAEEVAAIERGAYFASLAIERYQLGNSLQESQTRLETLVSNLPGMAYRCQNDPTWTMTYVSEGCEAVTGYRRDELEGNRAVAYAAIIHSDDCDWLWAKCQKSLDAHTPCLNEYRIIDRRGRERWVSERASGVYDEDGALLYIDGFIQDITAARQAKIEREQLDRKMLETQKLESLGVLAGGIAHDFNNLLTSILGNASIAATELPPGSSVMDCIEQINEASLRAADLCKQMLAYSGRGRFVVEQLDLGQLVEQTAQMLQISISKKAVLRFRLEKGLSRVEVDATQIRQVIMNLVINASEAIGDRSGVISLTTGLTRVDRAYLGGTLMDSDLPEGEYVYLEVSDTGSGMSAETRAKIFDPFFTTKFTGRGLGLAAVLGIVRGHRGALKVYSEVDQGTTFKLLFPAVMGTVDDAVPASAPPLAWHGQGTVLVVDDEENMRRTISRMMRKLDLDAVLTSDGHEALEIFRASPDLYSVVLLDLAMPHMDGEQTFSELRRLRPGVRVVLMSGFNAQEALVGFTGKGLANFLQKPFTLDALRVVLQEVLA